MLSRKHTLLPAALALALGAGALPAWGATQASLALQQVFGANAGSLVVAFGALDAMCVTPPATGVTCAPNVPANGATWYGAIQFRVRFTGAPAGTTVDIGVPACGVHFGTGLHAVLAGTGPKLYLEFS